MSRKFLLTVPETGVSNSRSHYLTTMRLRGKLKSWNDDRGFGFIDPTGGGPEIFVHIKAFTRRTGRPQVNQLLWFEVEMGPEGKKRAKNVEVVGKTVAATQAPRESSAKRGAARLLAIPSFAVLYIFVAFLWQPPLIILAAIYVLASVVTYIVYAEDKSAARRGTQRTSEITLHLLALACGWPGALLAQQYLRHKSIKFEFQVGFWTTVVLNVAGFVLFCSRWVSQ
jgi:uncharacterized membrane protein YsdA (DUF1294 family)/cold shock CspA family protein